MEGRRVKRDTWRETPVFTPPELSIRTLEQACRGILEQALLPTRYLSHGTQAGGAAPERKCHHCFGYFLHRTSISCGHGKITSALSSSILLVKGSVLLVKGSVCASPWPSMQDEIPPNRPDLELWRATSLVWYAIADECMRPWVYARVLRVQSGEYVFHEGLSHLAIAEHRWQSASVQTQWGSL